MGVGWNTGIRKTTKKLFTNLPEACSVCHMITKIGLDFLIQFYDSLLIVTILMWFIDKWKTKWSWKDSWLLNLLSEKVFFLWVSAWKECSFVRGTYGWTGHLLRRNSNYQPQWKLEGQETTGGGLCCRSWKE